MERQSNTHGNRVVTFGEAMIRLTPPGNERVERTISLNLSPGGAELNTAVTLACLGINASWISRLPENPLGRYLDRQAKAHGVDTSGVQWVPEREGRMGLYFLEEGVDPRPSAVTYDRAGSAMANLSSGAFEWSEIFAGVAAFHISGITPAISEGARAESFAAVRAANAAGVPVFFDLNYRSKLWTEEEARACFVELAPLVDVMFAGRGSMRTFFGIEGSHEEVMREARNRLGVAACVLTRKKATASRTLRLRSMAVGKTDEFVQTDWRDIEVVDRLGGGDAFAGGFIAGYLEDSENLARAVNLGLAASALKHTVPGDFLAATRAEIEAAATADAVAVLQR
ncbi:MAG: 2-dehydro-3-deoxygluconokinase [Thermomicrobiales bacterium]|nr:2-dehydro-3-deoxygluconokinase [Thermomicrobiales bacterium]MEA2595720.1 2-dehydro-3-deoxygluconokinase [Thermomicrobiales bacterium]